jgi:magnesium transporter
VLLGVVSLGIAYALLEAGVFFTSSESIDVALVVGLAALANLAIAAVAGAAIPLVLRGLGQDPALASSIFLTLITDVIGFGGFLLVASAFL